MAPLARNWAILLCKFSDDPNDPATTRVMDLAAQWRATMDAFWISQNLTSAWDSDNRTFLQLYEDFFTTTGIFTANIVDYYDNMSHGLFEMFGNQVFPITLDLTIAEGAALFLNPGGKDFQNKMFHEAKQILHSQYNINWKDFYAVAISFQDAEGGAQGSIDYDGGRGVFADIRHVKNNGTTDLGHEFGHAFGLDHSRTDGQFTSLCTGGAPSDYTDPWDIMSAIGCARFGSDLNYGMIGPGMNAWNMRAMQGLDESRIWKSPPNLSFSKTIVLNPLHQRGKTGFLGAELPGIGGQSSYLVEFRVPSLWDVAIGPPVVIVHRFEAPNSYIMKGTNGQKALQAGDTFLAGLGPFSKVTVRSIDPVEETATIDLCYSFLPFLAPIVRIEYVRDGSNRCEPQVPVEDTVAKFTVKLVGGTCNAGYQILWSVQGGTPLAGQSNSGSTFSVVMPNASQEVIVMVEVTLDDGSTLQGEYSFNPLSMDVAAFQQTLCMLGLERERPIPWWEWDPEKIVDTASEYTAAQWKGISEVAGKIAQIANRARALIE
jgi:hypothetical protein